MTRKWVPSLWPTLLPSRTTARAVTALGTGAEELGMVAHTYLPALGLDAEAGESHEFQASQHSVVRPCVTKRGTVALQWPSRRPA